MQTKREPTGVQDWNSLSDIVKKVCFWEFTAKMDLDGLAMMAGALLMWKGSGMYW